jgi:hypothetical protein
LQGISGEAVAWRYREPIITQQKSKSDAEKSGASFILKPCQKTNQNAVTKSSKQKSGLEVRIFCLIIYLE